MDLVVEGRTYDEYKMGAEEEGEKKGHRNCIPTYTRRLNEKNRPL
jgi:hypothetical protein